MAPKLRKHTGAVSNFVSVLPRSASSSEQSPPKTSLLKLLPQSFSPGASPIASSASSSISAAPSTPPRRKAADTPPDYVSPLLRTPVKTVQKRLFKKTPRTATGFTAKRPVLKLIHRRAKREAEAAEAQSILAATTSPEALAGQGLKPGRTAIATGLVHTSEGLNGKTLRLIKIVEGTHSNYWVAKPLDGSRALNLRPANLTWASLVKETEKTERAAQKVQAKKGARDAKKRVINVEAAVRAAKRLEEKSSRQAQMQAVRDKHKALRQQARKEQLEAKIAAIKARQAEKQALHETMAEAAAYAAKVVPEKPSPVSEPMAEAECLD